MNYNLTYKDKKSLCRCWALSSSSYLVCDTIFARSKYFIILHIFVSGGAGDGTVIFRQIVGIGSLWFTLPSSVLDHVLARLRPIV